MAEIGKHTDRNDWCHVCGNRSDHTADVWYPNNAEHETQPLTRYIRICAGCADAIASIASNPQFTDETRVARRFEKRRRTRAAKVTS